MGCVYPRGWCSVFDVKCGKKQPSDHSSNFTHVRVCRVRLSEGYILRDVYKTVGYKIRGTKPRWSCIAQCLRMSTHSMPASCQCRHRYPWTLACSCPPAGSVGYRSIDPCRSRVFRLTCPPSQSVVS